MNPRNRAFVQFLVLLVVMGLLLIVFPAALKFIEMAARELRYLWWLILLVALGAWLIWGAGRPKR